METTHVHQQKNKEDERYIKMEYYQAKKNEIVPFAAIWMNLEIIILSEVSQKEKDRYHITYMYLKHDTNDLKNSFTDTENKLMVNKREGRRER